MKPKAFTLIELLVVIVIIGILATISTATFSGYFSKSRDTERQTFINNAYRVLLASQLTQNTPDYDLGGSTAIETEANLKTILEAQGVKIPDSANSIDYYYGYVGSPQNGSPEGGPANFMVFVCKEDRLGDITGGPEEYAFLRVSEGIGAVLEEDPGNEAVGDTRMVHPCTSPPTAANAQTYFTATSGFGGGPVSTPWTFINLD